MLWIGALDIGTAVAAPAETGAVATGAAATGVAAVTDVFAVAEDNVEDVTAAANAVMHMPSAGRFG